MESVVAKMEAAGFTAAHHFGEKYRASFGAPPRYVWVPGRIREREAPITRGVAEFRNIFTFQQHFFIDVWGINFDHVSALLECVLKACNDSEFANFQIEGGEWAGPGKAWNQLGELFRLEASVSSPMADRYLSPEAINGAALAATAPTIFEPEPTTVLPARIEGDLRLTGDADEDGESVLDVSTSP